MTQTATDYDTHIDGLSSFGAGKARACKKTPIRLGIGGLQAGAYVGVAIILIMTLGDVAPASVRALIMGGAFGLALILVVIAGGELFTGYNLYAAVAVRKKKLSLAEALLANAWIFVANLLGASLLAAIYWLGQGTLTHGDGAVFLQDIAQKKMHLSAVALVARGALCNWLVCLALWMSRRVDSDTAKCIVIAWCLLAFIAAGFEHSVANMTVHALALLGPPMDSLSLSLAARNLAWVTVGNIIGGGVFVGLAYCAQTSESGEDTLRSNDDGRPSERTG